MAGYRAFYKGEQVFGNSTDFSEFTEKPKLNNEDIVLDNTSESLKIAMLITQAEYDALPDKSPYCLYLISDSEGTIDQRDWDDYSHLPAIDGITLTKDSSAADWSLMSRSKFYQDVYGVFLYKGAVDSLDDLPATPQVGWVYFVREENASYAYNNQGEWDQLGGSIDMSGYQKIQDRTLQTDAKNVPDAINEVWDLVQPFEIGSRDGTVPALDKDDATDYMILRSDAWIPVNDSTSPKSIKDFTYTNSPMTARAVYYSMPYINGTHNYNNYDNYYLPSSQTSTNGPITYDPDTGFSAEPIASATAATPIDSTSESFAADTKVRFALPTINDQTAVEYNIDTHIYAPTNKGEDGYILGSDGTKPMFKAIDNIIPERVAPTDSSTGVQGLINGSTGGIVTGGGLVTLDSPTAATSILSTSTGIATDATMFYGTPKINGNVFSGDQAYVAVPTTTGTSGQIWISNGDGTGIWQNQNAFANFTGATSSAAGAKGLVPAPAKGQQGYLLRGDGNWASFSYQIYSGCSSTAAGTAGLAPTPPSYANGYSVLCGDGSWRVSSAFPAMTGASSTAAGAAGMVPAPAKGQQGYALRGDGSWVSMPYVSRSRTSITGTLNITDTNYVWGYYTAYSRFYYVSFCFQRNGSSWKISANQQKTFLTNLSWAPHFRGQHLLGHHSDVDNGSSYPLNCILDSTNKKLLIETCCCDSYFYWADSEYLHINGTLYYTS